ncbi:MAG: hypothetical protein A3A57_01255 [Candidatus Woykebacteria bacterium RIFCSPLOWO2_01_FULL_41_12]|uniref:Uncharacterized protein n=1 Tax=Candidatus Woykebacteria bacterium RIFCSPLOWO2_01_FULL_41_12 TaxID=1802604 RepID=A0A1G1WY29_9BACT|nr:MAG: hypothetical protein A3A57_01255 [Candidatus Woykebacteria bacterium RIFCSPLOWO2_01_FULL_41_12]
MKNPWFKKGRTRIDIRPITWQGWVVLIIFIVLIVYNFFRIDSASHSASDTLIKFVPQTLILIALYFLSANNLSDSEEK